VGYIPSPEKAEGTTREEDPEAKKIQRKINSIIKTAQKSTS